MNALLILPGWLTGEGDVTLATWGLVFATLIVASISVAGIAWSIWDSKRKSREQREESAPKAQFGLTATKGLKGLDIWCANLGTTAFLADALQILPVVGAPQLLQLGNTPIIVPVGEIGSTTIPLTLITQAIHSNSKVSLRLQGPSHKNVTVESDYFLNIDTEQQWVSEVRPVQIRTLGCSRKWQITARSEGNYVDCSQIFRSWPSHPSRRVPARGLHGAA